tara:strand:- start:146 stop:1465 length:1320 start_codon:yes stop_codon:yes gene_type:complete
VKKMSGLNQIRTIQDLEAATYGNLGTNALLKGYGIGSGVNTGLHTDSSTGVFSPNALYNLVYGQKVWSMLNREINAFAMLPKKPWSSSGWRIMTERAIGGAGDTISITDGTGQGSITEGVIGGVEENAAFTTGATNAFSPIAPRYETLYVSPKTIAHQFELSELAAAMAQIDDGIGDLMAAYREEVGVTHAEMMNHMLLTPLESMSSGSNTMVTGIENNITSLYKIVSNEAELANADGGNLFDGTYSNAGYDKMRILYGKDRDDALTYLESYVDYGDYGGSRRPLTLNMLNTALRELQIRGASPKVILTGYDTIQALGELLQSQERYMGRTEVMPTVNGIKGVKGREVGFKVATYHDIPIIPCKEMGSTGSGTGLSDIFILDTDHFHFATLKPTEYFEGGIDSGDPFGVGKLGNRGMYRTIGEVVCTWVRAQGKITNLS